MGINNRRSRKSLSKHGGVTKNCLDVTAIENDHYFENLTLKSTGNGTLYFKRMRYLGCPELGRGKLHNSSFKKGSKLVHANRDKQLKIITNALSKIKSPDGRRTAYYKIIDFIRYCDDKGHEVDFDNPDESVISYMGYLKRSVDASRISNGTAQSRKHSLGLLLKEENHHRLHSSLPSFNGDRRRTPHSTLDDKTYTDIGKRLLKAYSLYQKSTLSGESLEFTPHYNEKELKSLDYSDKRLAEIKHAMRMFHSSESAITNHFVSHAITITFMFTGINTNPLLELTMLDVRKGFKKGVGDFYQLQSEKGRNLSSKQANEVGFTKRSKEFFEGWIRILPHIYKKYGQHLTDESPLFPYINSDNLVVFYEGWNCAPHTKINKVLKYFALPRVNSSIYRKTRSEKLYRATRGDTKLVADANNNSQKTTEKDYLYGSDERNQATLGSAFNAQYEIVKGKNKKEALNDHEVRIIDPLSNFEYQNLMNTPSGSCDTGNKDYDAKRKKSVRKKTGKKSTYCTEFWDCFECNAHAVIADGAEVHKLLSLRDSIVERMGLPAINNQINKESRAIINKVSHILEKIKLRNKIEYEKGIELNKKTPHPLWDDGFSFDDMRQVFNASISSRKTSKDQ
ncbi:hypothetical protein [Shewanella sp. 10N.286.48.B5]|uniref:hypothetical protein n=1 Tax=Shewanella sp. 10N.286.48.B5 TaxID=1880834 RepID=UPI000C82A654|nr:hypothetical protein [Shewanella sp. 10N.286.48.B5]PMH87012.1 hypothetical protein BCU57_08435 [Shewanella sp. 10N.286.48.B5]